MDKGYGIMDNRYGIRDMGNGIWDRGHCIKDKGYGAGFKWLRNLGVFSEFLWISKGFKGFSGIYRDFKKF